MDLLFLKRGGLAVLTCCVLQACSPAEKPVSSLSAEQQNELTLLTAKMQSYSVSVEPLERFKVTRSEFELVQGKPQIRFSVKNTTQHTVHHILIRLELLFPGDRVPRIMEFLSLPIEEGLISQGTKEWGLSPSNHKQWQQIPNIDSAKMTLSIESVGDKQGQPIYPTVMISKQDRLRYLELNDLAGH